MASIHLQGILVDTLGEIDVGAIITFTHLTTTGETIATTKVDLIIPPDGAYSIDVEFGQVRVDYTTRYTEQFVAIVIVNGDTVATNLPELLNAAVPVTDPVILQMQGILADAEAAADTSEAFANQMTTFDLIGSAAIFAPDTKITTKGYLTSGDGGLGSWVQNGVTGQTPSQSPIQLDDKLLNDGNGNQWAMLLDNDVEFDTFAEMQASTSGNVGQTLICRERANAKYIVQESGYSLLTGDVTLTNGTKAQLQIDPKGMDVLSFGATYDAAIDDAISRCANTCKILISSIETTDGKEYTSVDGVDIEFTDGGLLTLNDLADKDVIKFTTSTNIKIKNPLIDGNRTNQTVISGGSAFDALHFEACGNIRIQGGNITAAAASAVRGRNTSNMKVLDVTTSDSGYRQIYIAPSTVSGVNSNNILVEGCTVKWSSLADSSISAQPAISVTNNGASTFTNVSVKNNFIGQHPDNVTSSICIEGGGASNFNIEGNKCVNGGLGISWFDCDDFAVNGNVVQTGGNIGIECANRNINGTITGNSIDGAGTLENGISVNGGLGVCDNIVISGNPIAGVVNGIAMFGQSLAVRHTNITAANNNIICVGGGKPIKCEWVDGLSISGGILDGNSLSSSIIALTECDRFTITGTTQRNMQTFGVSMSSGVAVTITESFVGSNNFDAVPGNQQLNYVRNSLFAGSTVSDLVVRGNNRGPEFIDYGANILSWHGAGTPQGNITAGVGSTWTQTDGGASTVSWVKETLTTSSGWVGK